MFILISIGVSFFILFIEFTMAQGNIFDFYHNFIYDRFGEDKPKIYNLLAGCSYCYGFWISLIFFIFFKTFTNFMIGWYMLPIFIGITHFILRLCGKLDI